MCGICGYYGKNKIDGQQLKLMNDSIKYRGPDDSGIYQNVSNCGKQIGLAHRRLSILDLSKQGHQPMFSDDGKLAVVYNGEIYNFKSIRDELIELGYSFKSTCDTEVLLYAYKHWGSKMLDKLNGMFAFAFFDFNTENIFMARDRLGQKPLYYYCDNENFIFASELKPIMLHPNFRKEIRKETIAQYLVEKCIESPNTIFKNTYKLAPGHMLFFKDNEISIERYWDVNQKYLEGIDNKVDDFCTAKQELGNLIEDSVKKRLIADVPVGVFLSGGIDSSVIASFASKLSKDKINTFTIGFHNKEKNEAPQAKKIAQHLNTNHTELYVTEKDILDLVESIPDYFDEPFSDSSQIPTMLVSKLARKDVTVALAGDGGDEFFCGYEMYDWAKRAQMMEPIAKPIYHMLNIPGINKINFKKVMPKSAVALIDNRDINTKVQCFQSLKENVANSILKDKGEFCKSQWEKGISETKNWQVRRMLLDMQSYLPDEILCKVDRSSMRYSLESRAPFLDYRILEYSFRIPHKYKYHNGTKKYILKQIAYDYVPKEYLDMPKKGFGVPVAKWLRTTLSDRLNQYCDPVILEKQGIFDAEGVNALIKKTHHTTSTIYSSILWGVLVFQMWYQKYVEDLWI